MNSGHLETSHVTRLGRVLLIAERTLLPTLGLVLLLSVLTPSPSAWAQTPDDEEGAVSLSTEQPEMGIPISATLTDANENISGETWQWSSSDTATGTFSGISGATSTTYRPAETDLRKYLRATVSYTDGHGSGKTASETAAAAVRNVSERIFVDHLFRRSGLVMVDIPVVGEPGLATQFRTGGHPAGYEISEIRPSLPLDLPFGGSLSESDFRAHIYSADTDGNPDRSYLPMRPSFFQNGIHIFAPTVKRRLAPDTVYFFAMVSAGPLTSCNTADNDRYTSRASDWSTGVAFPLNAQGQWNTGMGMLERGCELKIEGEAAIDTAYVTGIDITSTPATARSYNTGDTLEATVTMSEAVTVDTASPPTLAIGISNDFLPTEDHRTMTYNATKSTNTALVFEYTVLAADDDQNGVAFNANVLMGTITRTSDSKAADKRHPFTNSDPDARVNAHPDVTVEFAEITYMVAEGGSVDVTVEVSEDPKRTVVIPITADVLLGGATFEDYSLGSANVTINSGETSGTVTFNATQDTDEDRGESIQLTFGTPPQGVTASGVITTTVTIIDDDPEVTVQFGSATYPVAEGDSVDVTVTLSGDPKRTVVIPLAATAQGTTSPSDYTDPVPSVTFDAGETSRTVRVSITEDTTNDDGESIVLSFGADLPLGVSEGATNETTVTIIEDDPPVTVSFGAATYAVDEGGSVSVSVTLSTDPQRTVVIPITASGLDGGSADDYTLASSVTFTSGDTTQTVSFSATEDIIDDDDESIRLAFGTLPPGVTGSGTTTTAVSINDNDDPEVTVQFGSATYSFAEGGGVTVTVKLDPDPERTVTIPLSTTYGGGATSADFSGIPGSLTFDSGIRSKTFRVTAVDDFIDNDGRTATVGFGAMLPERIGQGTTNETVVTITDTETRGVGVFPTALTIAEGQTEATTYTLTMRTRPSAPVTITINYPTDATVDPASFTFDETNWTAVRTVTVAAALDNEDEPTETVTITHTISGGDYGANNVTVSDVVVTITDDDASPVIVGSAAQSFDEIEYDHSNPAEFDREVVVFSATDADDAQTGDWVIEGPDRLQFFIEENDEGEGVLSFRSPPDFENPTDSGSDNTYEVTLSVTDGTNIATLDVIVTVAPVDETPTFSIGSLKTSREEIPYTQQDLVPGEAYRLLGIVSASDEEGDDITWSVGGDDAAAFNIMTVADRGHLRLDISPDFEDPADDDKNNAYDIIIKASDGENVAEVPYTLTITGVNEPPFIHDFTIPDYTEIEHDFTGTPPVVHTFTATDYEGDTIYWFLQSGDADDFNLDTSGPAGKAVLNFLQDGTAGPLPDYENPRDAGSDNVYSFDVIADDFNSPGLSAATVRVTNVNEKPVFTDTPTTTIARDENVGASDVLATYAARDEEGAITWTLTGADGGDFEITTDGQVTFRQTPNFEAALDADGDNVYSFNVVATDTMSGETRRNVSAAVTVTVADLEEDGTIAVDNADPGVGNTLRFTLTDPDGGIKTGTTTADGLEWTIEGRTGGSGAWTAITTVTNNTTFVTYLVDEDDTGKQLRASLTYEDRRGTGKTAESEPTKAVTVDPIANAPPRFRGDPSFLIAEGEGGRNVGAPLVVTDRDNDSLTFGIGAGDDGAFFAITSSGQLSLVQTVDFETAHLLGAARVLYVTVTLHDGKGVDGDNNVTTDTTVDVETTLTIQITDVEEEGTVTLSAEEPETGVELTATLEDGDGSVSGESWQWARSADGRTNWVNIADETANTYTPTEDDEDLYLRAQVKYADNRGPGKSAEGVADAPVPSANRRPAFPETEDGQRTVQENTRARINIDAPVAAADREGDRLIYTLTGADADAFEIIAGTGQLRTREVLDFESPADADKDNMYGVTVNVHDGRDGAGAASTAIDDTVDVTITVQNVEEPGTITLATLTGIIQARVEVTATLSDPDGVGTVAWQWSQSPNSRTGWANIAGATSITHTPLDDHEGQFLRVTATYTDGHGPNKVARTVSSRSVAGPPPANSAPVFPATEDGRREVLENAGVGATVGAPVAATDLNAGDSSVNAPLVYSLSGTDAASFAIDAGTGQLSLATGVTLDYETKRSYRVTVEVTDGYDQNGDDETPDVIDARLNVTINVTDVNEAPIVTGATSTSVQENTDRAVTRYTARDPERNSLAWSVSDTTNFWISQSGQLYFRSPPSFEVGTTTYEVTVVATDDDATAPLSGSFHVTVTVTDVEEEGVVTIAPPRGWVDAQTPFTATLADDDGSVSNEIWRWARSTNRSSWTDIPGATTETYSAAAGDEDHYLRATVQYTDGRGIGKEAEAVLTKRIGAARPAANVAPAFAEATATRSIGEGTAPGRSLGTALGAGDQDNEDVLFYSLSGSDADKFDIDPDTGQLRTKFVLEFGPEGTNTYTLTVNVHDGFDGSYNPSESVDASVEVTIIVTRRAPPSPLPFTAPPPTSTPASTPTPPATPPSFAEGDRTSRSVPADALAGDAVGSPVAALNPSNFTITYSLGGADAGRFTVDETTGQIRIGPGATLEEGGTYTVRLTASVAGGAGGSTASVDIEVSVNVLEPEFNRYDLNRDGALEKAEALKAVSDYFALIIEKEEVLEVISLYFASRGTETNE